MINRYFLKKNRELKVLYEVISIKLVSKINILIFLIIRIDLEKNKK